MRSRLAALTLLAGVLAACSGGDNGGVGADSSAGLGAVTVPVTQAGGNTSTHQVLESKVDGADISFQVYEPKTLEPGKSYPLVLQGHGYGGSRTVPAADGGPPPAGSFEERLTNAGYYVISIDERGFGESGGQVRVMDPEYEGQDLVAILDWAESLPGLRRRANGEMMVGSYGGSYGGMYQGLLLAVDPRHRLRVLAPDITPHDLTYSLQPNRVVKSGYGLALSGVGETGLQNFPEGGQDPVIFESLIQATTANAFSEASYNFFKYHSYTYYCDGVPAGPQDFVAATPDQLTIAPAHFPKADVLLTQGFRDTLFNFNEAYANYQCLKSAGGDVRLLTHQSGHILPVSLTSAPGLPDGTLEDTLDPFYEALTFPNFQDAGGSRACGSMNLDDVQFGWFEEKLQAKTGALNAVLKTGTDVCLSLAEGDAVQTKGVKVGGTPYTIDASTPEFNSALGVGGAALGNGAREALLATQALSLDTAPGGAIVAGIPMLHVSVTGLSGFEEDNCTVPLAVGACDPILFFAIGWQKAGATRWDIIDDQLTPVRGFGPHDLQMGGIAERLAPGDRLALLIYAFHAQFPVTWSRDLVIPAVQLEGTMELPLLAPSEIVHSGV